MNGKKAKALRRAVRKISAGKPSVQYVGEKRFHSNGKRVSIQCKLDPACTRAMVQALKHEYRGAHRG